MEAIKLLETLPTNKELDPLTYDVVFDTGNPLRFKSVLNNLNIWGMPTVEGIRELLKIINDSKVLEVMAGTGYLSKWLSSHGVDIIATDSCPYCWSSVDLKRDEIPRWFPVRKIGAVKAAKKFLDRQIVLMSWPMYDNPSAYETAQAMKSGQILLYIGESEGGCTADNDFFSYMGDAFKMVYEGEERSPDYGWPGTGWFSHWGIHDHVTAWEKK